MSEPWNFAAGLIRVHLAKILRCLGLGLLAYGVFTYTELPDVGFYPAAIVLMAAKGSLGEWQRWSLARKGESELTLALQSLPEEYLVLSSLALPDSMGNVDYLLIGPNGIFAIETENYSGYVKCYEEQWFVNGYRMRSFSKEAKRNSMAVTSSIAGLFIGNRSKTPSVVPLLLFVNPLAKLKLYRPTLSVLRVKDLVDFIRTYDATRPITENEKKAIVEHLQSVQPTFGELSDYAATSEDGL
ncbi:MAG: nuclease-related domain-containing protein [Candidatus Binatia bacterium]